jgi:hypothetical protein
MRLINQTRGTILANDLVFANTPFKRVKGLLGNKSFLAGQALIIKPCNCIHTLFMCFSIDVLFVDKNNKVVKALKKLEPFRFSKLYWPAQAVIELPCGKLQSSQTQDGDCLQFLD